MRTIGLVFAALATAALGKPQWHELGSYSYDAFKADFNKQHSEERRAVFEESLQHVIEFNRNSGASYKKGINHMSDWTAEERAQIASGVRRQASEQVTLQGEQVPDWIKQVPVKDLPTHVDWRDRGVVTAVKNQGHCGSCWAFGSTETIESHFAINTGHLVNLSPQQLVSCSGNPQKCGGWGGCSGSIADLAYQYVKENGMAEEYSYGYSVETSTGKSNGTCMADQVAKVANLSGFFKVDSNNATLMAQTLALAGPLAVNVKADNWGDYDSGIFDGCDFSKNIDIDHVVQLVGYTPDAWIIRNSWTSYWGESGYIRLKRYAPGSTPCGEDTSPHDGTGCLPGPSQVKVCGMCGVAYDASYPKGVGHA